MVHLIDYYIGDSSPDHGAASDYPLVHPNPMPAVTILSMAFSNRCPSRSSKAGVPVMSPREGALAMKVAISPLVIER